MRIGILEATLALAHPQFLTLEFAHLKLLRMCIRIHFLHTAAHATSEFLLDGAVYFRYVFVLMVVAHLSSH